MDFKIIIDRIEDNFAVLVFEDKQELIWPLNKLPQGLQEGDSLNINILTQDESNDSNKKLAKNILNEILSPNED